MQRRPILAALTAITAVSWSAGPTQAQRIIIEPVPVPIPIPVPPPRRPVPPPRPLPPPMRDQALIVRNHAVSVSITDGVAETRVDQLFVNPFDRIVEGTYIFPLADDVALGKFSMYVNGEEIEGKLLDVDEARRVYESIVASMRDPALLEYLGTRMFRARIFPINPRSEVRIKLAYTQMLETDDGLVRYRYPLDTERRSAVPIENVSVAVNIQSKTAIKSVFSPSHAVAVSKSTDHRASASWEDRSVHPDRDFELYYTLSDREFGMTVLTFRESGDDGFFLVRIAPPAQTDGKDVIAKDIAFVLDTSGSMAGEKIEQARAALKFCLSSLNPQDRFNVIAFSHEPSPFRDALVEASRENVDAGRSFADDLRASGGTNINDALLAALEAAPSGDQTRPYLIVFMTDGLPTIGTTDIQEILENVARCNADRVRLFAFGVGHDVNTRLLDLLAEQNRGTRDYVQPGEDLELKLSSFYRKVSDPVLADLALSFGDLRVFDMYPPKLGDLFSGMELVITGRYSGAGAKAVELTGMRRGTKERFVYETTFPSEATTHDFLPRLWATRKVGYLLDQIRLHGENRELKDEIVRLATRFGIVTPYTAYLVTEPGGVALDGRFDRNVLAQALRAGEADGALAGPPPSAPGSFAGQRLGRMSAAERTMAPAGGGAVGMDAVAASQAARTLQELDSASHVIDLMEEPTAPGGPIVRRVGTRTFYRVDDRWVDARHDDDAETVEIEAFSKEYFELAREHPDVAKCLALGNHVIVVADGKSYEIVPGAEQP